MALPVRVRNARRFNRRFAVLYMLSCALGCAAIVGASTLGPAWLMAGFVPAMALFVGPFMVWGKPLGQAHRVVRAWELVQDHQEAHRLEKEAQLLRLTG